MISILLSVKLTESLKKIYPEAIFGSLIVKDLVNKKKNDNLEQRKRKLEKSLRERRIPVTDHVIEKYQNHFKKWDKSYPIEFQIQTVINGRQLPQVSVLVDSMFHAELKNRILTSGHDLDLIIGDKLVFDVTRGDEKYLKIS